MSVQATTKATIQGYEWEISVDFPGLQEMLTGLIQTSSELKQLEQTPTEEMSFEAGALKPNLTDDGGVLWTVSSQRGKYSKFGVRVWREVLEAAGFDPDVAKKHDLTGWTAHLEERYGGKDDDGNEKTRLVVARLEAPAGQAPAEKPTTKPAQPPAEKPTAKPANGNGAPALPERPWDPESLKKALAYNAQTKASNGVTGTISTKDAQLIAGKMADALAGPARDGQDAGERKAAQETAKTDYHKCIGFLFDSAAGEDGSVSASNLKLAEAQTLLAWLLEPAVDPATGDINKNKWKWGLKEMAVQELDALRAVLNAQALASQEEFEF